MFKNRQKTIAWAIFTVILLVTLSLEGLMHPHVVFGPEDTLFFNAIFGFLSCVAIVIFSKFLGIFLKRKESYYKEGGND